MNIEEFNCQKRKIAVIGMGYVGMPLAVAFSKYYKVIGYDINDSKIECYQQGNDITNEVGNKGLQESNVCFTSDESKLKDVSLFVIAVPTPINQDKTPDLNPVEGASEIVGKYLTEGSIVVYESTVYPGVTEDICVPILEQKSGLKFIKDFKVGYSPERINPGDKVHRFENIKKIVSGCDEYSLNLIADIYGQVVKAGIHRAESIKVAEAAKVAENSQRDINIAFMNELAMVFDKMHIDTNDVLKAMNTKWNALGFAPGLVGGHCIGVDPYYFVYQAERLGYHSQIILAGRKVNDGMGAFVGEAIIKNLIKANILVKEAKILILGITFKENCPDIRNSKVIDIITALSEYGIKPFVFDPIADKNEVKREYNIDLCGIEELNNIDCIVYAVAHEEFRQDGFAQMVSFNENHKKVIIDVKGIRKEEASKESLYWSL